MSKAIKTQYFLASAYTALGLASGLFYREFTKFNGSPGGTQLAVVHTHWLTLGAILGLIFMLLENQFELSSLPKRWKAFLITYNVGVLLTGSMMIVKGCLQVLGNSFADSPMIAGMSGLGHMSVTAGFVLLLLMLGNKIGFFGKEQI
ncbi:DUF2871 domain-containing protein [Tessaracoccus sp. HDW20]|uniref:DUF2871 domain-containing protein n=1 Tax=Tessaracoccus coleopterorum TaxID=2714950 RepID=UPI0018D2D0C2|nr:DUF2871 domain-containing protein [Tessaracoccus coleopterorum]NHB85460.1 DUF2871 domain-containing protein [Tessaracoccus coleopterorum]